MVSSEVLRLREVEDKILKHIAALPSDAGAFGDLLELYRNLAKLDFAGAHVRNRELRGRIGNSMQLRRNITDLFEVYKRSLLFDAPHFLDPYMLYLEIDRPPAERFYQPRRKVLKRAVDCFQRLVDDELDEVVINTPPRVGKTTLLLFLMTWLIGRNSELANLYSAYSGIITKAFYSGVLEIIEDPDTYLWHNVFPAAKVVQTNALDETLNLDRRKRYPTLTCRSLYGTLNGSCDCDGFLISDDLIGGIEEALSPDRLMGAWYRVENNLLTRAKEKAKIIWCGTRWSMIDPTGLRLDLLENEDKFKERRVEIINIPALDEKDESNFDYSYGVGFSTNYYHQRRASFERNNDIASWTAQYMGEPIEREGALFLPEDFRFYNGVLPEGEPDRIFMGVDPAFGGGDYVAAPVCYQYGDDVYVTDVVYNDGDKRITQPLIVQKVLRNKVQAMRVEADKSTESYAQEVEAELKKNKYRLNMTTKAAGSNKSKAQRIFDKAPNIREQMIFLEEGKRSKEYSLFMQNVYSYKMMGKNKNDDAPDSLAIAMDMVLNPVVRAEIFKRTF